MSFFAFALASCNSDSIPRETPLPTAVPVSTPAQARPPQQNGAGGIVEEIRSYTEKGTPSSLIGALGIIQDRELNSTEFGRVMIAVNVTLLKTLYPAVQTRLPQPDPPLTHAYSRILKDAERGVYTPPPQNSVDYLEYVLPFLSLYPGAAGRGAPEGTADPANQRPDGARQTLRERFLAALSDLEKAETLNPESFLAGFFVGVLYEQLGRLEEAAGQYSVMWERFPECFPAAQGLARIMEVQGREQDALRFLQDLVVRFPDNLQVKRQLALAYYRGGDWSRAGAAVAEILQKDSRDGEFVLMRAHILVEEGQFLQAQAPLDIYASINPNNRLYLFLRARVQAEGYHNRDAALNYLRSILRSPAEGGNGTAGAPDTLPAVERPGDIWTVAAVYAARLFMESSRSEDQREGRELLGRLLAVPSPSLEVASLALEDAVRREAWRDARTYMVRLLEERRSPRDLLAAYTVEKAQNNNAAALAFARELYERDRSNEEGIITYISALVDTGRQEEASRMIESRLNGMAGGVLKSRYYYLRSRIRTSEELVMNDLRSGLFEDPRNLDALTAMFEIYHRRRDERRAVYYLKQALALAPNSPRLKRYEAEYSAALGSMF